jgi:hypothetical protein
MKLDSIVSAPAAFFRPLDLLLESGRAAGRPPVSARPRQAACRQVIP